MNDTAAPPAICGNTCASACAGATRALALPPGERRKKAGIGSLVALLVPAFGFPLGLGTLISTGEKYLWLMHPVLWPWEFWVVGIAGTAALMGGLGDWFYHRWITHCFVGRAERRCELLALAGGGVPMFALLSAASLSLAPQRFLVPVMVVLTYTTALICYDEFVYHRRRCRPLETLLHRILVFGNGTAFLAWAHWCFVNGGFAAHA